MDNPTSITAPNEEIKIPANNKSPTLILVQLATEISVSILLTLYPDIPAILPNAHAVTPEMITPTTVPRIAANVFLLYPVKIPIVMIVVKITVIIAALIGLIPR